MLNHLKFNSLFFIFFIPFTCLTNSLNLKNYDEGVQLKNHLELDNLISEGIKDEESSIAIVKSGKSLKVPKTGCVILYEKCKFKGNWVQLCHDSNDLKEQSFTKRIGSLKISKEFNVHLYTSVNFEGNLHQYIKNMRCVRSVGNQANSIRIVSNKAKVQAFSEKVFPVAKPKNGCAQVFEKKDYKGSWLQICKSVKSIKDQKISSIKVSKTIKLKLFSEKDFKGRSLFLANQSINNLKDQKFDSITNSIKIGLVKRKLHKINIYKQDIPAPTSPAENCVLVFDQCDFKGRWAHICRRVISTKSLKFTIRSIKLGKNAKARLFVGEKFKGKKLNIKKSKLCLKSNILSFKLFKKIKHVRYTTYPAHIKAPKLVPKRCIFIFEKCNFKGKWAKVCGKLKHLSEIGFDSKVLSIKVNKQSYVKFYKENAFEGKRRKFTKNKKCLEESDFFERVNSLRVFSFKKKRKKLYKLQKRLKIFKKGVDPKARKVCVLAYDKCNFKGQVARICKSIKSLKKYKFENRIMSIKLGEKVEFISLHNEKSFKGDAITSTKDIKCIDKEDFEKSIKSIRIVKEAKLKPKSDED